MITGAGTNSSRRRAGGILIASLALAAILAIALGAIVPAADESDAAGNDQIRVYIENESGGYDDPTTVNGVSTVKGAIEAALSIQGKSVTYNERGNVSSVDGRTLDNDHAWRVHQWLPLGTSGWGIMGFDTESDKMMKTGTSYCLHVSTITNDDGTNVYSVPNFKPVSTGYVFIRFANGYDASNPQVLNTFTAEVRQEGFWLSGTGSSMGEVLKNAVESTGLDIVLKTGVDANGNDLQCWIISMFGLGDTYMDNGTWAYWSQWTWVDGEWDYNNWTLGYYDPAVYKYVECVYLVSTPNPYGDGYIIDKGGKEPNPDVDDIVCLKSWNKVKFVSDGKTIKTDVILYGRQYPQNKIPEPTVPEGMRFVGWGNVTKIITEDTVFTAEFVKLTTCTVRYYYDDAKTVLLHAEQVLYGDPAIYDGVPTKPDTADCSYKFIGWSADLSCITGDIDVTPVFEESPKGHYHDWKLVSKTEPTCTSSGEAVYACGCGETKTETYPSLGHSWDSGKITRKATCTEDGVKTFTCLRCEETSTESIPPTGHTMKTGKIIRNATCTEDGERSFECSTCGMSVTEPIPATGHSWVVKKEVDATCTEDGIIDYVCKNKGCTEAKTEAIPKLNHVWSEWEVVKEATPDSLGERQRICANCNGKETESVLYIKEDGSGYISEDGVTTVVDADTGGAVTTIEIKDDGGKVSELDDAMVDRALKQIAAASKSDGADVDIEVRAGSSGFRMTSDALERLSGVKDCSIRIVSSLATIDLGSGVIGSMASGSGDLDLGVSADRSVADRFGDDVRNAMAISIDAVLGSSAVHELGGNVLVTLDYVLQDGVDAHDVCVWYVNGDRLEILDGVSYDPDTGKLSFTTNHLSSWIIGTEVPSDGGDGSVSIAIIAVAAIIAIIAAIVFVLRGKK